MRTRREFGEAIFQLNEVAGLSKWVRLSQEELYLLIDICLLDGSKNEVLKCLFGKNVSFESQLGKHRWKIIDKLHEEELIYVEEDRRSNSIVHFHYSEETINQIKEAQPDLFNNHSEREDIFSFTLHEKEFKSTNRTPTYSGTFKLNKTVILDANKEFTYVGWLQTDGSISIKITPSSENPMKDFDTNTVIKKSMSDALNGNDRSTERNEIPFNRLNTEDDYPF